MENRKILRDSAFFFVANGAIFNTMLSIIFKPPNLNNYTFFPVGNYPPTRKTGRPKKPGRRKFRSTFPEQAINDGGQFKTQLRKVAGPRVPDGVFGHRGI